MYNFNSKKIKNVEKTYLNLIDNEETRQLAVIHLYRSELEAKIIARLYFLFMIPHRTIRRCMK